MRWDRAIPCIFPSLLLKLYTLVTTPISHPPVFPYITAHHSHLTKHGVMHQNPTHPRKRKGVHIGNLQIPLGMDSEFSQEVLSAGALKNPIGKKLLPGNMTQK